MYTRQQFLMLYSLRAALMLLTVNGIGFFCILCDYFGIERKMARNMSRFTLSIFMILEGYAHFNVELMPFYMNIIPPFLPYKELCVHLSGLSEMIGGICSLSQSNSTQNIG
eukprot:409984_1